MNWKIAKWWRDVTKCALHRIYTHRAMFSYIILNYCSHNSDGNSVSDTNYFPPFLTYFVPVAFDTMSPGSSRGLCSDLKLWAAWLIGIGSLYFKRIVYIILILCDLIYGLWMLTFANFQLSACFADSPRLFIL